MFIICYHKGTAINRRKKRMDNKDKAGAVVSTTASGTASTTTPEEFFLPDLCSAQALFFLVLVAELLAIVLELAANGLTQFNWYSLARISFYIQWNVLLDAALLCQLRKSLSGGSVQLAAAISYGLILTVAVLTSVIGQWLLNGALSGSGNWHINNDSVLVSLIICAVLAGIALRYFYLTQQLRIQQQIELQARIQALQSRIRPHFLFNSMNIIASLIAIDQEAAETAVEDLAALFRASLAEATTQVPLSQELDLCLKYARIEQLRLGDRLQIDWRLDDVPKDLLIPSLSLQPLLENAIYHGIQRLPEGGTVTVKGNYKEPWLTIETINPMPKAMTPTESGNKMAQANIHNRLQALYGPKAELTTVIEGDQHRAILRYPVSLTDIKV
jgi:two-component system sensor histidine kinase AlgZ